MKKNIDELTSHNYDGIQEYDNDLPKWWVYLFYLTILYSVGYVAYYEFGPGKSPHEILSEDMNALNALKEQVAASSASSSHDLTEFLNDAQKIEKGKKLYSSYCAACHGAQGQGVVGPNLTDKYWLHGGQPSEIRTSISEGIPEKGMIAWKSTLPSEDLDALTIYIISLKGSQPPNPKSPEGEIIVE